MPNKQIDQAPLLGAVRRTATERQQSSSDRFAITPRARAGALSMITLVVAAVGVSLVLVASTGRSTVNDGPGASDTPGTATSLEQQADGDQAPVSAIDTPTAADESLDPGSTSSVSVQVANSTNVTGAAGTQTDELKTHGYIVRAATNATTEALGTTKVHHEPGYLLHARQLAAILGLDPDAAVFPMPANPAEHVDQFEDANLLVILGADTAD